MPTNYCKLWNLLDARGMKKGDLRKITKLSTASMAKLAKNKNVYTDVLVRICNALDCKIQDIMEITK